MILAVDPGVSTGVAVLNDDGSIRYTTVLRAVEEAHGYFWALKKDYEETGTAINAVAEEGPKGTSNFRPHIQDIEEVIKEFFPDVTWVPPGQWKGHPASKPTHELKGLTQHEKDAVGLGRWFRRVKLATTKDT